MKLRDMLLWLDTDAALRSDMARVLDVLQRGLESAGHAKFVKANARRIK